MSEFEITPEMRLSIDRCKSLLLSWPGAIFYLPERQIGKTTAILEICAEQHQGKAIVVTPMQSLAKFSQHLWRKMEHGLNIQMPAIVTIYDESDVRALFQGTDKYSTWPIYVDEWEMIPLRARTYLLEIATYAGSIVTGIGQPEEYRGWHEWKREKKYSKISL